MSLAVDLFLRAMMMMEMLLFTALFVIPLPRRKYAAIRIIIALSVCLGCAMAWNPAWSSTIFMNIVYSFLQFLLLILSTEFCFEVSWWIALYCGLGGIALQRIALQITRLLTGLKAAPLSFMQGTFYINILIIVAFLAAGYFIFTVKIRRDGFANMGSAVNILLCLVFLLSSVILSSICNSYRLGMEPVVEYMVRIYDLLSCLFVLWLERSIFNLHKAEEEAAVLQQLFEREKKQMALTQTTVDMINIKCHDMKHLLSMIAAEKDNSYEKELEQIGELINIYDFSVDTGNDTLNLILAEKGLHCQKMGIQINCIAEGSLLDHMEKSDVYSLFSNALDNAVQAVDQLKEDSKKIIKLTVRSAAGMTRICIENYYDGEIQFDDGLPVTSQEDTIVHGYGMKSIRHIVQKYSGEMEVTAEQGIFSLNILMEA